MKTKEYIRIQLDADPQAVRAWLESAAASAQRIDKRAFYVVSLEIAPVMPITSAEPTEPAEPAQPTSHQRRYGIFNGSGMLVLNADLHCPDAHTTVLELRRDDAFPLVAEELKLRLDERFPGASAEVLAEKPRARAGAPPLACNVWLEEQLRLLPNPAHHHHLYSAWLAHYTTLRGYEPLDPRRSFRAAASSCLQRLHACNDA